MSRHDDKYREWAEIVARCEASGLSIAEFCRREQLPEWKFFSWRRRLRSKGSADSGFVKVEFDESPRDCGVRVVVGDVRIELASGFDASELGRVLQTVGTVSC